MMTGKISVAEGPITLVERPRDGSQAPSPDDDEGA
jgi:hypothetical protein